LIKVAARNAIFSSLYHLVPAKKAVLDFGRGTNLPGAGGCSAHPVLEWEKIEAIH
jgi:hypothetical protein